MDVNKLLQEISADAPCGEDLEYDPKFLEMQEAAKGKAEQQMGDEVVAGTPPDWKTVRRAALELFARTRDLRVAVYMTRGSLAVDGLGSLADHLQLIHGLLDKFWDDVHPKLDPEDDNDPTMRVNVVASLCGDEVLRNVREAPLVESKVLGRFSLRDVDIAQGKTPAPPQKDGDPPPPDMSQIDAAFLDCDLDGLQSTAASVDRAVEHAAAIEKTLTDKVGAAQAADLSALPNLLRQAQSLLAENLQRRGVAAAGPGAPAGAPGAPGGAAGPQPIQGEIQSREDVIRMLDKACDYFARNEPSSPVPLLLKRAKRLVSKDFMEIIKDLAPEGVKPIEKISGTES